MGEVIANEGMPNNLGSVADEPSQNKATESMDKKSTEEIADGDSSNRMTEEVIDEEAADTVKDKEDKDRLHKMGLNTAIAIGLHNFPEGKHIQRNFNTLPKLVRI